MRHVRGPARDTSESLSFAALDVSNVATAWAVYPENAPTRRASFQLIERRMQRSESAYVLTLCIRTQALHTYSLKL